ncbi:tryptophan synthase beta subunit-like PLP-dependent enzyme [Jimgerdemannia flammicorona]|uniref:Tryptophan synthase beta subunit-like PLP-dependent enzyme n=2 Tax=Jimgerdemannia flammicorona TaxID=994334 RepID=A0A433QCE1_9FUNG|nr:tryptophan synthase beta subunit-like PLP-dependent enzyme [Jimgerdemannia flammicorona]RUS27443.1 tryptophan synthase beta subunit-like PLP-dependent enzyme [Jimgerdemannia flammicorona]
MVMEFIHLETSTHQPFIKDSRFIDLPPVPTTYNLLFTPSYSESSYSSTPTLLATPELSPSLSPLSAPVPDPANPALVIHLTLTSPLYDVPRALSSAPNPTSVVDVLKIQKTPLQPATKLSRKLGATVLIKREDAHPEVFSTEARGVGNWLLNVMKTEKGNVEAVCSVSEGTHADALSLLSTRVSVPYHPTTAHLMDPLDPHILGGYGTVAMELMTQHPINRIAAVFCPVGTTPESWGLAVAVAIYVKRIASHVQVIAVCLQDRNEAAKVWGREFVDEVIDVTEAEVTLAIKDTYEDTRILPDTFGTLSIAGVTKYVRGRPTTQYVDVDAKPEPDSLIAILASANMTFEALARWTTDVKRIKAEPEVMVDASR